MKAFNLEEAKAGKPICTREGAIVKFIAHVPEAAEDYRVVTLGDKGIVFCYTEKGCLYSGDTLSDKDLFMQPVKRTVWVNLYKDGTCQRYSEESAADNYGKYEARIGDKAYPIEIED